MKKIKESIKKYLYNEFITHIPIWPIRKLFITKFMGIKIGYQSFIAMDVFITGFNIQIGNNTVINKFCYMDGRVSLKIGNNVNISNYTYIQTLTHDPQDPEFKGVPGPVIINSNVWIGARSIILTGITLGEGCVIGAGSVVTKSIPEYKIAVGVPAKVIKERNSHLTYKTIYKPILG